jgi:glycosyltransferase involved in cell wall biosynthesis
LKPLTSTQKRWAASLLRQRALRPVLKASYLGLLETELAVFRLLDRLHEQSDNENLDLVTAVIKTFERPTRCQALINSIRLFYPTLKIIVVDDSNEPKRFAGSTTISLPYDSGVSAGRSAGLASVETKYVLNLDDDFVFYSRTNVPAAVTLMEQYDEIDIMGGCVVDLPLFIRHDYRTGNLHPHETKSLKPGGQKIGNLEVYDKVPNFFLGRTESVRRVDWDCNLKRIDHADFFTRAKGILTSVLNPELDVLHVRNPFDWVYLEKRLDLSADIAYLRQKYARPWTHKGN